MIARLRVSLENPHLLIARPRRRNVRKGPRANEEVVAIWHELHAQEPRMHVMGEEADVARGDLHLVRIAEALFHEGNALAVGRPRRPLAEVREPRHPFRQLVLRAALTRTLGCTP